jgi:hypothetical protein
MGRTWRASTVYTVHSRRPDDVWTKGSIGDMVFPGPVIGYTQGSQVVSITGTHPGEIKSEALLAFDQLMNFSSGAKPLVRSGFLQKYSPASCAQRLHRVAFPICLSNVGNDIMTFLRVLPRYCVRMPQEARHSWLASVGTWQDNRQW